MFLLLLLLTPYICICVYICMYYLYILPRALVHKHVIQGFYHQQYHSGHAWGCRTQRPLDMMEANSCMSHGQNSLRTLYSLCTNYMDSQVAGNNLPLYPQVDHYWFNEIAQNHEPLALQVFVNEEFWPWLSYKIFWWAAPWRMANLGEAGRGSEGRL